MKKAVLIFYINLCVLAKCQQEVFFEGDREVCIHFSAQSLLSSLLKSAANIEDNSVENLLLYGVDTQGNVIQDFFMENPSLNDTTLTISKKVKSFYAIANPSSDLIAANPSNLSDLMDMTENFANLPRSPFLMGGKGEVNGKNVQIELFRTVAKIEITSNNDFQITSVTVNNTPDRGFVFEKETPSTPSSVSMIAYPIVYSPTPVLYVSENSKQNPTEFVVNGTYLGKQATYTIVLTINDIAIDIARNTHYQVVISAITETDCSIAVTTPPIANNHHSYEDTYKHGIKILAIGNSYSQNTLHYTVAMLRQLGVTGEIKIICAYLGGKFLKHHVENMKNNTYSVDFRKQIFHHNCEIQWIESATPLSVVTEDDWDVIMLQQADDEPLPMFVTYNDVREICD